MDEHSRTDCCRATCRRLVLEDCWCLGLQCGTTTVYHHGLTIEATARSSIGTCSQQEGITQGN
jgi:hypothetical protein